MTIVRVKITPPVTPPPATYNGWRVKWTAEGGNDNPLNMPAVTPSQYNGTKFGASVPMTRDIQELSFAVMRHFNPTITAAQWRYFHKDDVAICNNQGFDGTYSDGTSKPPRADFVNGLNLTSPLPQLMDGIVFAGYMVRGTIRDGHLWVTPSIGAIDATKPLPTVEQVIANNWYMFGVDNTANPSYWVRNDNKIALPFILSEECPYTLAYMDEWNAAGLPDPLQYYV